MNESLTEPDRQPPNHHAGSRTKSGKKDDLESSLLSDKTFVMFREYRARRKGLSKPPSPQRFRSESTDDRCLQKFFQSMQRYCLGFCLGVMIFLAIFATIIVFIHSYMQQRHASNSHKDKFSGDIIDGPLYPPDNKSYQITWTASISLAGCSDLPESSDSFCFLIKPQNFSLSNTDKVDFFLECETNKYHDGLLLRGKHIPPGVQIDSLPGEPRISMLYFVRPPGPRLAGHYTCLATHARADEIEVIRASSWLMAAPPVIKKEDASDGPAEPCLIEFILTPQYSDVPQHKPHSMSCMTKDSSHITWLKDGQPISDKLITLDSTKGQISWSSVQRHHAGVYTCVATKSALKRHCRSSVAGRLVVRTDAYLDGDAMGCGRRAFPESRPKHSLGVSTTTSHPFDDSYYDSTEFDDDEYDVYFYSNEDPKRPVIAGASVPPGHIPWQVMLYDVTTNRLKCGGSLVDRRHVVTAAHCLVNFGTKKHQLELRLGAHDITRFTTGEQRFRDATFCSHKRFKKSTYENDIAIIRLPKEIEFTPFIAPVCVPESFSVDKLARVSGWGSTGHGNPRILQEATLPIQSRDVCTNATSHLVTHAMFCAGFTSGESMADACKGDSGGPLVSSATSLSWQLDGVVSWGDGCGYMGYYTKVSSFRSWMITTIRDWEEGRQPRCLP